MEETKTGNMIHCALCLTDQRPIQMRAQRIDEKIVGWLFICDGCKDKDVRKVVIGPYET